MFWPYFVQFVKNPDVFQRVFEITEQIATDDIHAEFNQK
tara:strand:- start:22408 stop:22524 length:117 start_codon:yes stop_codon:yes gene_type:complete